MCDCIEKILEKLNNSMKATFPEEDYDIIKPVEFENITILLPSGKEVLINPVIGIIQKKGKKIKEKFKTSILPKYCCYCGEELKLNNK